MAGVEGGAPIVEADETGSVQSERSSGDVAR